MKLEVLEARLQEIELAIVNTSNQLNALNGHKAEAQHWLDELKKAAEETKVEEPVAEPAKKK